MSETFEVTDDHLILVRELYWTWDDCEFGAPAVDPKRPYGNSDVVGDIAAILRYEAITDPDNEDEPYFDEEDASNMERSHYALVSLLEIACQRLAFPAPGSVWRKNPAGRWVEA